MIRRTPASRLDKPQALPARFRPLAERIVGPRVVVRVVHGAVTRAALEAAGHEAATTNRVIHLPSAPDSSARTMSIVAHELEHVAAPSPVARFHGGVDSPEERRAARTESVVRRLASNINRRGGATSSAGTAGLPVSGLPAFGRTGSAESDDEIQRKLDRNGRPESRVKRPDPVEDPDDPDNPNNAAGRPRSRVKRPKRDEEETTENPTNRPQSRVTRPAAAAAAEAGAGGSSGSSGSAALSPAHLSAIIRAVEDRLLEEIERRGGLRRGSF